MSVTKPSPLVTTGWLAEHIHDPELRILDASWHLPSEQRDARADYHAHHIPGARFFDIDEVADQSSTLPHMAPSPAQFVHQMAGLGVGDGHRIVVYDSVGLFSAARAWWLFKLMGIASSVLDGGLPKWRREGRALGTGHDLPRPQPLVARRQRTLVRTRADIERLIESAAEQIIDARAPGRFNGSEPEPRPGLRSGHIPTSLNLPFAKLIADDGTLKSPAMITATLIDAGVDPARPIVTSCGSGVTAAIINLALETIGHCNHALYDGSWAEWGLSADVSDH